MAEMSAKNFVCPQDKRRFATKAALDQHKAASHQGNPGVAKTRQKPASAGKRLNNAARAKTNNVLANFPQTEQTELSGTDRIFSVDARSENLASRSMVLNHLIELNMSRRMMAVARAFEKHKWLSLQFRIACKGASTISGGFVACFVPDPEDESVSFDTVLSHTGAVSGKWCDTQVITARLPTIDLYNSSGPDARFRSPGRLVVYSDGAPSSERVPITIDMMWRVRFMYPGYEETKESAPDLIFQVDATMIESEDFLVPAGQSAATAGDAATFFGTAAIASFTYAQLPFALTVYKGDKSYVGDAWFVANQDGKLRLFYDRAFKKPAPVYVVVDKNVVIAAGTRLTRIEKDPAPRLDEWDPERPLWVPDNQSGMSQSGSIGGRSKQPQSTVEMLCARLETLERLMSSMRTYSGGSVSEEELQMLDS